MTVFIASSLLREVNLILKNLTKIFSRPQLMLFQTILFETISGLWHVQFWSKEGKGKIRINK